MTRKKPLQRKTNRSVPFEDAEAQKIQKILDNAPEITTDLARKLLEFENGDVVKILNRLQIGENFIPEYSPLIQNAIHAPSIFNNVMNNTGITRKKRSLSK